MIHLAVVLFREGEFDAAAKEWRWVLEASRARSVALPEPVHLNLARGEVDATGWQSPPRMPDDLRTGRELDRDRDI